MTIINRKKKHSFTSVILGLLIVWFCTSCIDRYESIGKYKRPERLTGKLYTQISTQENMSIFSQFMVDIGYDKVVDKTGTYAIFVPDDEVMKTYLMDKYGTSDPSAIDSTVKNALVKYCIIPMPWSNVQLQTLSALGWINLDDVSNNKPTAFKRKTLLREPNRTYNVRRVFLPGSEPQDIILPDNEASSTTRTVFTSSPKYVPLFYDGFMSAKGLNTEDYEFYFKRAFEPGEVYYANSKIIGKEIFADNGFVYTIDRVVEPLKNAEQLMEAGPYSKFLQLIHNNPVFRFNKPATQAQEGAAEGAEVTDLYDLFYTNFPINIHDELVGNRTSTVELHRGVLAPTNEAMDQFFDTYLKAWGSSWNSVPVKIQQRFVETHIATEPVYKKDFNSGFYNADGDIITSEDFEIEDASYGSNSTFIGLKKAIVPRYFSSVSAPLVLNPEYNSFYGAYSAVNLLSALKDPSTDFSLFIMDNQPLALDSTLFVTEQAGGRVQIMAWDQQEKRMVNMLGSEYRRIFTRRLYGQIGIQPILGVAKREFIETMDGRHIVVQNDTVSGGAPSQFGFNSTDRDTTVVFSEITDFPITNGHVYKCDGWLEFPTRNTYEYLRNTKFLTLLNKVGLASAVNERLTFMDATERYTIFVPSDAALNSMQVDTLSLADLKKLVYFHIVKGELIFTDGRLPQKAYRTLDNKFLNLNPQPDNLLILDKNYNVIYDKLVVSSTSNLIGMYPQTSAERYFISNAVVHRIDTVIKPY